MPVALIEHLRRQSIVLPALNAVERPSAEVITRANWRIYDALDEPLPDAIITESCLKITPLDAAVPDTAQVLIDQSAMILPHVKISELLREVDEWTGFTLHFAHLKSSDLAKDKNLLLTTILADAINLGPTKMAESCPGTTYAKLAWLQAWHIRDETCGAALAELVNAQFRHPFAERRGDGTTSSSDGQNSHTGSEIESIGYFNPKYGISPAPCSSTGCAKSATAALSSSATGPAASTWRRRPSCCGTRSIWNERHTDCAATAMPSMTACCSNCRRWARSTST